MTQDKLIIATANRAKRTQSTVWGGRDGDVNSGLMVCAHPDGWFRVGTHLHEYGRWANDTQSGYVVGGQIVSIKAEEPL